MRKLHGLLIAAMLVAGGSSTVTPAAEATVTAATVPLQVANNSGRTDAVYLYVLGTNLATGQQGWADSGGGFHAWPAGGTPPTPAPDASIPGPANGQSITIRLPKFSGRVYFSYGQKLKFFVTTGGLVQPDVNNPTDPNRNILFNWSEYTLNDSGLWINSTQVDMFSAPYAVGLKNTSGTVRNTGHLKSGGYQGFFKALTGQPGGWANLIQRDPSGNILRAIAPGHGIAAGALPASVMNDYVNRVWSKYGSATLTVQPFADQPGVRYYGRVSGNVMNFTNGAGQVVTSFQKPDSDSIFGCYKLLDAPNDQVRGPISRTLCAGFNRSTLLTSTTQPDTNAADFYQDVVTNHYARKIHAQMQDGKAYAFAFDDVGNFESLVNDSNPATAYLTLDPLG